MLTTYTPTCEYVTSADGTRIYSEAVGDPSKPAIIFIHGFQLSSVAFDSIFDDPKWTDKLYLVRWLGLYTCYALTAGRFATIREDMEEVTSPQTMYIGHQIAWRKISTPSFKSTRWFDHSLLAGEFGCHFWAEASLMLAGMTVGVSEVCTSRFSESRVLIFPQRRTLPTSCHFIPLRI